jgi:hypothetical protein
MRVDEVHAIAMTAQVELVDDAVVEETDEVRAWAHDESRVLEWMVESTGSADTVTSLQHKHGATRPREVCGGGQSVVAGADDNSVPRDVVVGEAHRQARRYVMA